MTESIGFHRAVRAAHDLAGSARPDAPVIADDPRPARIRSSRRWLAARLRGMARGTYHLANRVDPVGLPGRGAAV